MEALLKEERAEPMRKTKIPAAQSMRLTVSSLFLDNGVHAARARTTEERRRTAAARNTGNEAPKYKIASKI